MGGIQRLLLFSLPRHALGFLPMAELRAVFLREQAQATNRCRGSRQRICVWGVAACGVFFAGPEGRGDTQVRLVMQEILAPRALVRMCRFFAWSPYAVGAARQ